MRARCVSITPFGLPVVPEVYTSAARSVGSGPAGSSAPSPVASQWSMLVTVREGVSSVSMPSSVITTVLRSGRSSAFSMSRQRESLVVTRYRAPESRKMKAEEPAVSMACRGTGTRAQVRAAMSKHTASIPLGRSMATRS